MKQSTFIGIIIWFCLIILFANWAFCVDTQIAIFKHVGTGDSCWVTDAALTFQANAIIVFSNEDSAFWWSSTMGTNNCMVMSSLNHFRAGLILQVDDDSFQVSESDLINKNSSEYQIIAIKTDDVYSKVGTWAGDGNDNRWINIGIDLDFIMAQPDYLPGIWRVDGGIGDSTTFIDSPSPLSINNYIQDIDDDSIQVGNSGYVNAAAHDYYYLALANIDSIIYAAKSPIGDGNDHQSRDLGFNYTPDFAMICKIDRTTDTGFRTSEIQNSLSDWTDNAVGSASTEGINSFISGGYTVSYHTIFYINQSGKYDWVLLLNEGSSMPIKNVTVIF